MTPAEYRAYDAAIAVADKYPPETREAIAAARQHRDQSREAWKLASQEWLVAGSAKDKRSEKATRRLDELAAQKEQTRRAYEAAERQLQQLEFDARLNRDIRRRAVKADWQMRVDERTLVTTNVIRKIRVFESTEERDAAYATGKAR